MILWFLRLFVAFREVDGLAVQRGDLIARQEAKIDGLRADVERWQNRVIDADGRISATGKDNHDLRVALDETQQQSLRLQDRLDAALEDRNRLWSLLSDAIQGERTAYQAHINQAWQKQGGGVPYPDAPHLPETATPKPQEGGQVGRPARILSSADVDHETDSYWKRRATKTGTQ